MLTTWLGHAMVLLQGSSVVVMSGLLIFAVPALRRQLLFQQRSISKQATLVMLFALLAIYGTHAGKVVTENKTQETPAWSQQLKQGDAVVNFRDMVVVAAGLAGGPLMGLLVGGIAGLERYSLGGFTALPCAIASVISGLLAGLFRLRARTIVIPYQAAIVAATTVVIQMALILLLAKPFSDSLILVHQIGLPMILTAAIGCYAFQQVLRGLDKVRLELEARKTKIRAQRAEIRALHAQIEPHFLMNVLNAINALIRIEPNKARHYVTLLGDFLQQTRSFAMQDTISIKDELQHAQAYINFQMLRFSTHIDYQVQVDDAMLFKYQVPPRSLLTLIENALLHAFNDNSKRHTIRVKVTKREGQLIISVSDNGVGITQDKILDIGKAPVASNHEGGGLGLYHLKQTLKKLYGANSTLEVSSLAPQGGTTVRLLLPANNKNKELS